MGLDMYLRAELYVSGYPHSDRKERERYEALRDLLGLPPKATAEDSPSATASFTVAYWRKANAIHRWFVENVQDGEDECRPHMVSREQMGELVDVCTRVRDSLDMKPGQVHVGTAFENGQSKELYENGEVATNTKLAEELLPTVDGFFFGGTHYDSYYRRDLEYTIEQLTKVLDLLPDKRPEGAMFGWSFEYQSSW